MIEPIAVSTRRQQYINDVNVPANVTCKHAPQNSDNIHLQIMCHSHKTSDVIEDYFQLALPGYQILVVYQRGCSMPGIDTKHQHNMSTPGQVWASMGRYYFNILVPYHSARCFIVWTWTSPGHYTHLVVFWCANGVLWGDGTGVFPIRRNPIRRN